VADIDALRLRPDAPTILTADGDKLPVGVTDEAGYISQVRTSADGTLYLHAQPSDKTVYGTPLEDLNYNDEPLTTIDEYRAAQIALARIMISVRWYAVAAERLIAKGDLVRSDVHKLRAVAFDMLPHGQESGETRALITEGAPGDYDSTALTPEYDEDTVDALTPGTVLRDYGMARFTLRVEIEFPHKDERAGFRGGFVRKLLADPQRDAGGRRVVVPEYLNQVITLELADASSVSYPDTSELAARGIFPFEALVMADAPVVGLVPTQARLLPSTSINVE
jgi:hypothetical protein